MGVGYEIGQAVAMNKKILCLFRPESGRSENDRWWAFYNSSCVGLSAMVQGAHVGDSFVVKSYQEAEVEHILQDYFAP